MRRAGKAGWIRAGLMGLVVGATLVSGPGARAENIVDALVGAYNTSGLLEQNRAVLRSADEDVALAVSSLRPVVDFILRASRTFNATGSDLTARSVTNRSGLTAQFSATWLLWDGGETRLSIEEAKETVLATRQQLLGIEQQILLRAAAAYVNVLLRQENVLLRRNNLRLLGEELRAAQDRFDVGEVTRTDVALAQSRVAAARSDLSSAEGDLINARAEYANAVGHAPGTLAGQPRLPARPASVETAKAVALRRHPNLLAARHQVSAAELAIQSAAKGFGPKLRAAADIGATERLNSSIYSEDASVSLTLSQRLYQGGGISAGYRKLIAARDRARGNLLIVQGDIVQDVNDAFVRLQVAQASLIATAERVRAARVAFEGVREEATLGARTTLDVLSAEQELLNAQTAQISARSEQSVAAYQLLAAQGLLTAEQLRLKVQIYDPTLYYNLAKDAPAAVSKQTKQLDRVLRALQKR